MKTLLNRLLSRKKNLDNNLPYNFISFIDKNKIRVNNATEPASIFLKKLGGHIENIFGENYWVLDFEDVQQLSELLSTLNEAGFLFVGEPSGWPPAGVFNNLRERKLISGIFTEVTWSGPGKWETRIR